MRFGVSQQNGACSQLNDLVLRMSDTNLSSLADSCDIISQVLIENINKIMCSSCDSVTGSHDNEETDSAPLLSGGWPSSLDSPTSQPASLGSLSQPMSLGSGTGVCVCVYFRFVCT